MPPEPHITTERIVEHLGGVYGLDVHEVVPLAAGDVQGTLYRIDAVEGAHFLKLRRDRHPPPLARHLADAGISHVLAPLRRRDPDAPTRIRDLTVLLYPFIEGENAFRRPLNQDQWTELGAVVRSVHDAKLPSSLSGTMRHETYSDVWRASVRAYLTAIPRRAANDVVARELVALLSTTRTTIARLIEHAEQLAASLSHRNLPNVPCHGDLHAGNILVDGGGSLTIVDWDDPVLAPKERDLMFIGAGIGGAWNCADESSAFYRGYSRANVDAEAIAYYRCERIVEDVAVYCDRLLLPGGDEGAERARSLRRLVSAFSPNGVVEIAKKTFANL